MVDFVRFVEKLELCFVYGWIGFWRDVLLRVCCGCFGLYNYNFLYECGELCFIFDLNSGFNGWVNGFRVCLDFEYCVLG